MGSVGIICAGFWALERRTEILSKIYRAPVRPVVPAPDVEMAFLAPAPAPAPAPHPAAPDPDRHPGIRPGPGVHPDPDPDPGPDPRLQRGGAAAAVGTEARIEEEIDTDLFSLFGTDHSQLLAIADAMTERNYASTDQCDICQWCNAFVASVPPSPLAPQYPDNIRQARFVAMLGVEWVTEQPPLSSNRRHHKSTVVRFWGSAVLPDQNCSIQLGPCGPTLREPNTTHPGPASTTAQDDFEAALSPCKPHAGIATILHPL
ncbi:hypothetical protein J3F83DRAFT_712749 [Trichoderma novae-zelandiae]